MRRTPFFVSWMIGLNGVSLLISIFGVVPLGISQTNVYSPKERPCALSGRSCHGDSDSPVPLCWKCSANSVVSFAPVDRSVCGPARGAVA